ncbi:MAG: DUF6261 family protein [Moheibacter sp.]
MLAIPKLGQFRQGDLIQYMNNLLGILTEARATTLNLESQREDLYLAMRDLNITWQPQVGSELTPEIAALDQKRDRIFTGLKGTVDIWATNHFQESWRNAAFLISDNIAAHGNKITVLRYQQQTATINAILNDLEGHLSAQITTLGLEDWVDELRAVNLEFDTKYLERAQAMSGHQPGIVVQQIGVATTNFQALKTAFESRFNVAIMDSLPVVTDFQQVENEWNMITDQYNDAVTRYLGSAEEPEPET